MHDRAVRVSMTLSERNFPELARALRNRSASILRRWRADSIAAMPDLERLTAAEFESSTGLLIDALAGALESREPERVHRFMREASVPFTSILARSAQRFSGSILLAEDCVFRFVLISELREEMKRPLVPAEILALHTLLDLLVEQRLTELTGPGNKMRESAYRRHLMNKQRLEQMGTLVAGIAHDAINLFLPLHMRLEHIENTQLTPEAREDLKFVQLLVLQFQNSIVNLRWLSVESVRTMSPAESLDLGEWAVQVAKFHRGMLPLGIALEVDLPAELSRVRISAAALSQVVFNLIRNAQQAIEAGQTEAEHAVMGGRRWEGGVGRHIRISARPTSDGTVTLAVEDNGPGMSPHTLERCTDPFFTTRGGGSGLGLSLVRELVMGSGGEIEFLSPPPGKPCGTLVLITLPVA